MRASDVSRRMNSCSFDISRLKKPTVMPSFVPMCCAMFRQKLVLPIDGRAATMTRSPGWRPDVISSSSVKPVGTPVTSPFCFCSCSIVSKLSRTSSPIDTKPVRIDASAISKICRSAPSRSSSASWSAPYASSRMRFEAKISRRRVDFSLMMRA